MGNQSVSEVTIAVVVVHFGASLAGSGTEC